MIRVGNLINLLTLIYIATMPISSVVFDVFAIQLPVFGTFSIIDTVRLLLIVLLILIPKRVSESYEPLSHDKWIKYFMFFLIILFMYVIGKNNLILANDIQGFLKGVIKNSLFLTPAFLILYKRVFLSINYSSLNTAVLASSILLFLTVIFSNFFGSISGLEHQVSIAETGVIERHTGNFVFGDINSMAAFQVMIMGFFLCMYRLERTTTLYVSIVTLIAVITVLLVISRGAMISIVLVFTIYFFQNIKKRSTYKSVLLIFATLVVTFLLYSDYYDAAVYRLVESGVTQKDLDVDQRGRLASYIFFINNIGNNPEVLLYGDTDNRLRFGRQTVHNAYLRMILIGGIVPFIIFLYYNLKLGWLLSRNEGLIIFIPLIIGMMTLPDYMSMVVLILLVSYYLMQLKVSMSIDEESLEEKGLAEKV